MDSAITIIGLNHEGAGIGHLQDGRVIFVPGALPGEQVLVEVVSVKRNYARGRLVEVVEASPDRVLPPARKRPPVAGAICNTWTIGPSCIGSVVW